MLVFCLFHSIPASLILFHVSINLRLASTIDLLVIPSLFSQIIYHYEALVCRPHLQL